MSKVAVIGGGIAGCTVAVELAEAGLEVVLFEKEEQLGGNIKNYGCKATDICTRCNLCLVDSIFQKVRKKSEINIYFNTSVNDCFTEKKEFTLITEQNGINEEISGIEAIVLATGHTKWSDLETGTTEIFEDERIIWASEFEDMLEKRQDQLSGQSLEFNLGFKPESAVFLQCNGSRSIQQKARYCSKVCCGYNFRIAKVLRNNFPDMELGMFFIDMQEAGFMVDLSFSDLDEYQIDYECSKPLRLERNKAELILHYEDQKKGKMSSIETDLLVLSEGIHSNNTNKKWSKIFNLQLTQEGFLKSIWQPQKSGVYLAGTITSPGDIATTITSSKTTAYQILENRWEGIKV